MKPKTQREVKGGLFLISETSPEQVFTPEDFNE